ncbi:MAG TPA: TauD/TfdA family dioxygenase [Burkholderiales bacterium]|nr:TauD/TfdA family dioxygenase [Burkholderiales bacterium]
MLAIRPLSDVMGAEVLGADLSLPLDKNHFDRIREAFHRHLLLVFPGQHIDEAQQVAFSRRFGELQVHVLDQYRHPRHPEIYVLSNVDQTDRTTGEHPDKGTLVWHSDLSFQRRPALATILYGIEVPGTGGDTLFADMCAAYDALDSATKEFLSARKAVHDLDVSRRRAGEPPMSAQQRAAAPPVEHPVVRTHPDTGRKILYISRHVSHLAGLPRDESDALLERLMAHATRERFVFRHRWGTRDVVMWDNRCTMHCATHYDPGAERRVIHRTVVKGDVPV